MTIAQPAHEPTTERAERWAAIQQRTTRGLLTFNADGVMHLAGDLWAVRSTTRGGYHRVDLAGESCTCEDWTHFGSERGIPCRHVYAVAIAHATRRAPTARCAGCRKRFPRREMVTVDPDRHDGLVFFDGDLVCRPCARKNGVAY